MPHRPVLHIGILGGQRDKGKASQVKIPRGSLDNLVISWRLGQKRVRLLGHGKSGPCTQVGRKTFGHFLGPRRGRRTGGSAPHFKAFGEAAPEKIFPGGLVARHVLMGTFNLETIFFFSVHFLSSKHLDFLDRQALRTLACTCAFTHLTFQKIRFYAMYFLPSSWPYCPAPPRM